MLVRQYWRLNLLHFHPVLRQNKDLWFKQSKKNPQNTQHPPAQKNQQDSKWPSEILYSVDVPRTSQQGLRSAQNEMATFSQGK